jgi:putative ABC transport system ATP-binding protein
MILISISNLSFSYSGHSHPVLSNISLDIRSGEVVILTGPSGSGKTTLLTLIGALRLSHQGRVSVLNQVLSTPRSCDQIRPYIGYIFQHHNLIDALTCVQNVSLALELLPSYSDQERIEMSKACLNSVGLLKYSDVYPKTLSGGQRQRVAIARALVREPDLVLADEPTASLDFEAARQVMNQFQERAKTKMMTTVLITHDYRLMPYASRVIHLEDGQLKEEKAL